MRDACFNQKVMLMGARRSMGSLWNDNVKLWVAYIVCFLNEKKYKLFIDLHADLSTDSRYFCICAYIYIYLFLEEVTKTFLSCILKRLLKKGLNQMTY